MGRELMVLTMSTQECNCDDLVIVGALVMKNRNRRRGISPWSRHRQRSDLGETGEFPKPSATDDSNANGICWYSRALVDDLRSAAGYPICHLCKCWEEQPFSGPIASPTGFFEEVVQGGTTESGRE